MVFGGLASSYGHGSSQGRVLFRITQLLLSLYAPCGCADELLSCNIRGGFGNLNIKYCSEMQEGQH